MSDAPEVLRDAFAPQAPAPEREPVKFWSMLYTVNDEAERIENVEAAREKAGEPRNAERMQRAEVFRALARFLTLIEPHLPEIRTMVSRPKRRRG